ncbi:ubiquitin domain-containing protein 7SL RNA1-like [Humulus lupulus]|uniref:ubiquitin domain-containing protein 7SL RNA1-like n=1 Tax=Humulus lupulus TaxID=3486 RepID=UPI002B40B688|nr:ubiquitin domain-containing protein 7SL RNA1-like [Humulus lupulus]
MDVIFDPPNGKSFSIEVGFFDTILEIKQKIERYHAIPIPSQTLVFNRQVLQDERDVADCDILQNSHIRLIIASSDHFDRPTANDDATINVDEDSPAPIFLNNKISLNLKIPTPTPHVVPVEMDVNDTVSSLKDKIQEMEPSVVSAKRLVLHSSSGLVELQDKRSLSECELSENAEIEVSLRRSPTATVVGGPKKLKLVVIPKCGSKRAVVEMSPYDNVAELRKELEKLRQMGSQFPLPPEGYFFIYKQNVMDEDKSFRWHHVSQGDSVDIFNGSVTGGS